MAWSGEGKSEPCVGVIGLGYVGLPLLLQFNRAGVRALGFDIDPETVAALKAARSYIKHIPSDTLKQALATNRFDATCDYARVAECDALLICVPTPLTKHRTPDIGYILAAGKQIGPHLKPGQLVVLESTTYPGTTDEDLKPVLESLSGMRAGLDFYLAYSPEREDPGNPKYRTADIPKVAGGLTPACLEAALKLYSMGGLSIIPVSSTRAAEATKLMENIFRAVNIALVNELKLVFEKMGVDIWEVIGAAKTKPFGYMPFYPGPGLGGHCIPIDPFYLTWKAREYGLHTRFIELAGEINTAMPKHVVQRVQEELSLRGKPLKDAQILLLGLAYKKNVDDMRESPALVLWEELEARGAQVRYADPHIPVVPKSREHAHFAGRRAETVSDELLRQQDAVLIATDHDGVDYAQVVREAPLVFDTRNACSALDVTLRAAKVVKV
ncbi:MAG: nucleotide sugar dehydrogenase [Planctomycetes bacterium]|nr:nucleotide sugar dehydrogenase [Planctomycetota bacterium]